MQGKSRMRLRAAAAAGLVVGGSVAARSFGAIVNAQGSGNILVEGRVSQGTPTDQFAELHEYAENPDTPFGLGPVHLSRSGHAEVATPSNASARSSALLDAVIAPDAARDTLTFSVSMRIFADTNVAARTPDRVNFANAVSDGSFTFGFELTGHSYDYDLTPGNFSVNPAEGVAGNGGSADIEFKSGTNFLFHKEHFTGRPPTVDGSLQGTLAPGFYSFDLRVDGSATTDGGHFDGAAGATLLLTATVPESKWANPAGGSFQTETNWNPQHVPGTPDGAVVDQPGRYTIQLDQDVTNKRLRVNGAGVNASFDLAGHNYTVDQLSVGGKAGDRATFTIKDSGGITVAAAPFAGARVAASGGAFTVNDMDVDAGGEVDIAALTSSDTVRVDHGGKVAMIGADADWRTRSLTVGGEDVGSLAIGSGKVSSSTVVIGDKASSLFNSGGVGDVQVSGTPANETIWVTKELEVGRSGKGTLLVGSGGTLLGEKMVVGSEAGGTGTITVNGGNLDIPTGFTALIIGLRGDGHLTVRGAAKVDVPILAVGGGIGGTGEVTATGLGSEIHSARMNVGGSGRGMVTVNGGAVLAVGDGTSLGEANILPNGTVNVADGGTLRADRFLEVDGELHVASGGVVSVGTGAGTLGKVTVQPGGTLQGTGTIFGRVLLAGGTAGFTGHVRPGHSPGTLTVQGDFAQEANGVLDIEVAGTDPGRFDVLAIVGDASIGGDLTLSFLDGFAPHAGDRFDFLTATGALTGRFQHVDVFNLAPGFQFDLRADNGHYALVALNDGVAVPEPATGAILLLPLALLRRRRRSVA